MQNSVSALIILAATLGLSACASLNALGETPGVTMVDVSTAKNMLDSDVAFIDLRGYEYIEGHVPGAVHLDWNESFDEENLAKVVNKDQAFVVYCYGHGCFRSRKASSLAVGWGYQKVYHFAGGFRAWKAKGYPVE